ncbi:MAG: efflux RND transporter periplasmic adaptor subunit [Boseongicola sp.]|nr:efflux RND transporter periplasmic adaptor subunit [Boseongicola sp.]
MLNKLTIERDGQPAGAVAHLDAKRSKKGLLLGAMALAVGSGLVVANWGSIETTASGASLEPASQAESAVSLEVLPTPELAATPAPDLTEASPNQGPVTVLDATGYVVARRKATVSAKVTGKLTDVFVEEGDQVQAGQLIALLDDSSVQAELALAESRLTSAQSRLRELRISIDHADKRLARSVELARRHLVSVERLDDDRLAKEGLAAKLTSAEREIEVARRQRDVREVQVADTRIRAPFSGVVVEKSAHPGEVVSPMSAGGGFTRTGIGTIVDMDSLEVEVDINEAYLNRVFPNQPVRVKLNAYPGNSYEAQVIAIVPTADRNKATVRVRIGLLEKDGRVLPNMGVQVGFVSEAGARGAAASQLTG